LSVNRAFLFDGAACVVRSFHWLRGKYSLGMISERTEKHGDIFVPLKTSFSILHQPHLLYQAVFPVIKVTTVFLSGSKTCKNIYHPLKLTETKQFDTITTDQIATNIDICIGKVLTG